MTANVSHSPQSSHALDERLAALVARWQTYRQLGGFEQFVEFSVALNSLSEQLGRLRLPGLLRIAQGWRMRRWRGSVIRKATRWRETDQLALDRQVQTLAGAIASARQPVGERRAEEGRVVSSDPEWVRPRAVWLVAAGGNSLADHLDRQLCHFGFAHFALDWKQELPAEDAPMAVLFLPEGRR